MKRVLVISGSPRKKGNTMSIVKIIGDRMKKLDSNIEFSYLYLIDKNLRWCRGCMNCMKKGGAFCPLQKDDMISIKEEIDKADGIVFASPGYAHQVSALFKNFMDRFMYLDHLPEYIGLPALVVTTDETDGATSVAKYINFYHARIWGCDVAGILGVHYTFFMTNPVYRHRIMKDIDKITVKFFKALTTDNNNQKRPSLMQYLFFLYNQDETKLYEDIFTGRYEFWKERGWISSDYYYQTKIPLHHRACGRLASVILNTYAKKNIGRDYKNRLFDYYGIIK